MINKTVFNKHLKEHFRDRKDIAMTEEAKEVLFEIVTQVTTNFLTDMLNHSEPPKGSEEKTISKNSVLKAYDWIFGTPYKPSEV